MKAILIGLLLIGATGCAWNANRTDSAAATLAAEKAANLHCTREVPTGSHRTIRTCKTAAQIEYERENAAQIRRNSESVRMGGKEPRPPIRP